MPDEDGRLPQVILRKGGNVRDPLAQRERSGNRGGIGTGRHASSGAGKVDGDDSHRSPHALVHAPEEVGSASHSMEGQDGTSLAGLFEVNFRPARSDNSPSHARRPGG
jgi:hypothetical protein